MPPARATREGEHESREGAGTQPGTPGSTARQHCAAAKGSTSSGTIRASIPANEHAPVPAKESTAGASSATAILHRRLYVAIVATLAPSMPPITTAAIATGASTQIIAPCATVRSRGSSRK